MLRRSFIRQSCLLSTALSHQAISVARADDSGDPWEPLDREARAAVLAERVPGVVFVVGQRDRILYRKAFGKRAVKPDVEEMTMDTIFDLASLTKVVATTSAVMGLIEDGRLRIKDLVTKHWPEFGAGGKDKVQIRHLLTHTSGLAAWDNYERQFGNPMGPALQPHTDQVLSAIAKATSRSEPGTKFVYSDLGFITLGEIVKRVSGKPLDVYARERIFEPLGMHETTFVPPKEWAPRIAPTTFGRGEWLRGAVHDGNSAMCGGIAGHAGLYSTAHDLSRFARMLLSSDTDRPGRFPLSPTTVRWMTSPQTAPGVPVRGYGWDIDTGYSHVRGDLMPLGSFGHTGFTGTYLWVDPYAQAFIIGLSNRVHPDGKGSPLELWARAANIMCGRIRGGRLPDRRPI